jgi:hypothetical protein
VTGNLYSPATPARIACVQTDLLSRRICLWAGLVVTCATLVTSAAEFTNTNVITIPALPGGANPYPSTIAVSGIRGPVSAVRVKLNGVTYAFPDSLDIFLVAPGGRVCAVMSDAGRFGDLQNASLVFDDEAVTTLP